MMCAPVIMISYPFPVFHFSFTAVCQIMHAPELVLSSNC